MSSTPREIRFLFDFISHNAYLAWTQIHGLAERNGAVVRPVPVLFGALLNAHGQLGPAEVPVKSAWMLRNVLRKAVRLGVTVKPPPSHPFNPLPALRAASVPMPEDDRRRLVDALFRTVWAGGAGIDDEEKVAAVATSVGLDGPGLVGSATTPEGRARLRQQTDEALAAGVFGVPSMLVDGELFWGYDDLEYLDLYLQGRDPLPQDELAAWEQVRPSVVRRR